jgi:hypothetical protein
MKIKEGFVVRTVGGKYVAVPTGKASDGFCGMITLNETGKLLFEALGNPQDIDTLTDLLMAEYEVDAETARNAVVAFTESLRKEGILEA